MFGVDCLVGTDLGLNMYEHTNQHSLVFIKFTVKRHVFIYFLRSLKLENSSKILQDSILFNPFIYSMKGTFSKHTHFVIVSQNQWNFIDFTRSIVLKYNF